MMNLLQKIVLTLLIGCFFTACNNTEPENKKIFQSKVYRLYTISGEEGNDWVNCYFQFRSGKNGYSFILEEPEGIRFDTEALSPDSTLEKEFFYELQMPAADFSGKHTITYQDENGKAFSDEFVYKPFRLTKEPGETVSRKELVLQLAGLEEGDKLRVVMTDTAFESRGINKFYPVENGELDLRPYLEGNILNGPVMLQLFKEEEKALESSPQNGRLSLTYGLKREFELKD